MWNWVKGLFFFSVWTALFVLLLALYMEVFDVEDQIKILQDEVSILRYNDN